MLAFLQTSDITKTYCHFSLNFVLAAHFPLNGLYNVIFWVLLKDISSEYILLIYILNLNDKYFLNCYNRLRSFSLWFFNWTERILCKGLWKIPSSFVDDVELGKAWEQEGSLFNKLQYHNIKRFHMIHRCLIYLWTYSQVLCCTRFFCENGQRYK